MCNGFNFDRGLFHSIFGAFKIQLVEVHKVNENATTRAQRICPSDNFFQSDGKENLHVGTVSLWTLRHLLNMFSIRN